MRVTKHRSAYRRNAGIAQILNPFSCLFVAIPLSSPFLFVFFVFFVAILSP